jgi:adenine/guanine phosphoribosyltransferase-like PRPP-binding protein
MPSGYLDIAMDVSTRRKTVAEVNEIIRKIRKRVQLDAIVCRGISGMSIAFQVSDATDLRLVIIRKTDEVCHGNPIEFGTDTSSKRADKAIKNYVIIDDFITSGHTMNTIMTKMADVGIHTVPTIILYAYQSKESLRIFLGGFEHHKKPKVITLHLT